MKTLKQYFKEAKTDKWAIGHFNFSTADQLKAMAEISQEIKMPIMAGVSEGEAEFLGIEQAVALVGSWQEQGVPVFLNADHFKSFEKTKEAIDAGFDSVLIDGSTLSFEENVTITKEVVEYAKEVSISSGREITVEGELGYMKGSSEIQQKVEISPEDFTKPEEAIRFISETGVDRLAIVFGNIHGIVTQQEEKLDIETLKKVAEAVPDIVLVLHGASGLGDEQIKEAIANGVTNVHINTELRVAYHEALEEEIKKEPDQTTPYKFLTPSYEATKRLVEEKIKLFKNLG